MSFVEFLLEYYIYILAVLVVLIVGVIGFLVDSKNKGKKKKSASVVETSNVEVNPNNSADVVADNVTVNPMTNDSVVGNNLNNVMPDMVASPVENNGGDLVQSIQPVLNNEVVNPVGSNNDLNNLASFQSNMVNNGTMVSNENVNNGMMDVLGNVSSQNLIQPGMASVSGNPIPVMPVNNSINDNLQSNMVNNDLNSIASFQPSMVGNDNVVNNQNPVQSTVYGVSSNPIPVVPIQVENVVNTNLDQSNVMRGPNGQSVMSNMVQPDVNVRMQNNMNSIQNLQPVMPNGGVNTVETNAVNSNAALNNGVNFNSQNQVVGNEMLGQSMMSGGNQGSLNSGVNVQNTNMAGQIGSNGNLVGNNNVVTTDGSKPFDISSMFPNNQ